MIPADQKPIRVVLASRGLYHGWTDDLAVDVRRALEAEQSIGYVTGRVITLTNIADALGLPHEGGGTADDLERDVLDHIRSLKEQAG